MNVLRKLFSSKNKHMIKFCQKNLDRHFDRGSINKLSSILERSNIEIKEYECLSQCEICKKEMYCYVDSNFVSARTSEELVKKIENYKL